MTKKKIAPVRKYEPAQFKVEETVLKVQPKSMPANLLEEKEKFLRSGKAPKFDIKDRAKLDELALNSRNRIRFELLGEAQYILDKVYDTYGNGEYFLEHAFGVRISKEEATPMLLNYISENNLTESMRIHWCDNIACSAKLVWTGPVVNANRPDLRKYSLWINGSAENNYMRESGIRCLMDHEIGTHFFRSFNDGFQPWFSERERFGLRKLGTFEGQCTEEGLAAINTVLRGRVKYLWGAALAYYTACKATEMTFKQLFDHLGHYTSNREYRWKQAMRVKRGLEDPNDLGGFGNDQCYFEGAVAILRNMENIDFHLLMAGKVCYDELSRIKRVARKDVIKFPAFMKNMAAYRKTLSKMITLNGLNNFPPQRGPPDCYIKRLSERKNGKKGSKSKKVRSSSKLNFLAKKISSSKKESNKAENKVPDEVQSFKCAHPFVNLHLRKSVGISDESTTKFLRKSDALIDDVTKLSENIDAKDSTLIEQIQKLQNIVDKHLWVSEEADYKQSLIKDAEGVVNESLFSKSALCENQVSRYNENVIPCALNEAVFDCKVEAAPLTAREITTTVNFDSRNTPETSVFSPSARKNKQKHPLSLPPNSLEKASREYITCMSESLSSSSLGSDDCCSNFDELNSTIQDPVSDHKTSESLVSTTNQFIYENQVTLTNTQGPILLKRKHSQQHQQSQHHQPAAPQPNRRLLSTPIASLTTHEMVTEELYQSLPMEFSSTQKRISLKHPMNTPGDADVDWTNMYGSKPNVLPSLRGKGDEIYGSTMSINAENDSAMTASACKSGHSLSDSNCVLPSVSEVVRKRNGGVGSSSASYEFSSDNDLEAVLQMRKHDFLPGVSQRKRDVSQQQSSRTAAHILREGSNSVINANSNSHSCASELSNCSVNAFNDHTSYYQPLVISSSKPLLVKDGDGPRKRYSCY